MMTREKVYRFRVRKDLEEGMQDHGLYINRFMINMCGKTMEFVREPSWSPYDYEDVFYGWGWSKAWLEPPVDYQLEMRL